ncbi:hypothetical protein AAIG33_24965 [Phytobacter ursingii]|uniref:hypothetical protein n=1 Tax=Phytobacter ursingii TaxID=1972431 RepID=UPI0031B77E87
MKVLIVGIFLLTPLLSSCSWDPGGFKAQQKWLEQKKAEQVAKDQQFSENQDKREKQAALDKASFEASHPEVLAKKKDFDANSPAEKSLKNALYSFEFVTRYPENQTGENVYVHVGRSVLTAKMVSNSIVAYMEHCKRVSAYTDENYKDACMIVLAKGISDFTTMLKDEKIPGLTKQAALSDASYGNFIDFEHAARLARMHTSLCKQQGDKGYVTMITTAAPCAGFKGTGIN